MSGGPAPLDEPAFYAALDRYFAPRLEEHGATARGVDWNGRESQELRFEQLMRIADRAAGRFSLNDYGCGYGALAHHLLAREVDVDYRGFDVSERMVALAREHDPDPSRTRWTTDRDELEPADFTVASGLFNLRLDVDDATWTGFVHETLDDLAARSRRGFAFNMLTSWSDPPKMRADLFYGDPCAFFAHCKSRFSRDVALLHDYGLYEWTILVRTGG